MDVCARSLRDNNRTPLYLIGGFKGISNLPPVPPAIASSRDPLISDIIWERFVSGGFAISDGVERFRPFRATTSGAWRTLSACFTPVNSSAIVHERMKAVSSLTGCDCLSVRMRHNDGTCGKSRLGWSSCAAGPVKSRIIGALKDITPKAVRDLPLLQPAQISSLTGLYTLEAGQAIIEKNLLTGLNLQALILVDFRNLDEIEQRHGNRWKNLFLQHAGAILRNLARENDVPIHCRAGSFILFADQYESFREVTDLTRNLQRTLGAVCASDGESDSVEFSIGIAVAPYDALTFSGLVDRAAQACSQRSGVNFYDKQAADCSRLDSELLEEERRREKEQMREALQTIMDNVDAYLFVVHPFRHEVLFANRQIRSIRPECVPGSVCYRSFFRFDKPCVDCAILKGRDCLIEKDGQQIYLQLRHKRIPAAQR